MKTFPINIVLHDRLVVLIGAKGEIAGKPPLLVEAGARVRVIAPSVAAEVAVLVAAGKIEWLPRRYEPGDLKGATLVYAATNDPEVHAQIWAEGAGNGQLVNVVDVKEYCNFHSASFMRRGLLTIAIGTGGAAPALAVTIRRRFEQEFGSEYAAFLDYAQSLRPVLAQRVPSFRRRQRFWYNLVESDALGLLAAGRHDDMAHLAQRLMAEA
jgi:precorrin-2 dehydrogenase / sirohydrochlorin ferrochelatase